VVLPGSKSQTNRALVLAALADGPSRVRRPLRARDTALMADALRALGARIDDVGADWMLTPAPLRETVAPVRVDTGLAGTVMRFVPPVAALSAAAVTFDGDSRARERPMSALLDGLRQAGATIEDDGRGRMPFTVRGTGRMRGGLVRIDTAASSQFVSGLLLAGARYERGMTVRHIGADAVPSQPHLRMTARMLRDAGVGVDVAGSTWRVVPGPIHARDVLIEPDLSNAAPFLAAALVTGGAVTVPDWPARTTQAGDAIRELFIGLGASVRLDGDGLTVRGGGPIAAIDADLREVSELATVIAALAALADGPSRLSGLGHTRGHETDRLAALASELRGLGGDVDELADGLVIRPVPLRGGLWHAHGDHRMATAGAVLGLAVDGVRIDDIAATAKTLPGFMGLWSKLVLGPDAEPTSRDR